MTDIFDPHDPLAFRRVLGHFASGITIVTANPRNRRVGFTCQSFASVSLQPPLIGFFAAVESSAWEGIREAGAFTVNVLAHRQENLARIFAMRGVDKFHDVEVSTTPNGSPLLEGVIAWIDCQVEEIFKAGDHDGVLGRVTALAHVDNSSPLLYFRGGYGTFQS